MPQLWIVAGPNGAGKSSLVARFNRGRVAIINPDNLFAEDPSLGLIGAGRKALAQQATYLRGKESFLIETTFSGNREIALMRDAKEKGFKVNLVYVGLATPQASVLRVAARVLAGGHNVPADDIRRRRERSLANLPEGAMTADRAFLFDNSRRKHRLILVHEEGRLRMVAKSIPAWLKPHLPKAWTRQIEQERGMSR